MDSKDRHKKTGGTYRMSDEAEAAYDTLLFRHGSLLVRLGIKGKKDLLDYLLVEFCRVQEDRRKRDQS